MYTDAGYGDNWAPTANARRLNPYSRTCAAFGGLCVIGSVVVIIAVLSLIPLYLSKSSSSSNGYVQVARMNVNGYVLSFQAPSTDFNEQTILTIPNNFQALQAALTAMLQTDSIIAGSIVEINTTSVNPRRRRQSSTTRSIIFNLSVTSNKLCTSNTCLKQFESHATNILTNRTTNQVRYQAPITTNTPSTFYRFVYDLPKVIQPDTTFVYVDPKAISSLLNTLLMIDQIENLPLSGDLRTSTASING